MRHRNCCAPMIAASGVELQDTIAGERLGCLFPAGLAERKGPGS